MAGSTERPLGPKVSSTLDNGDSPTKTGGEKVSMQKPLVAISEEETESITSVSPPDGGWGWWVVFASFMIHIVADGITYSFGIFLVALIDKFNADRGYASLIPSILVGITLGAGPIASSFVNKYGCRTVTIIGAIIASGGLALSMFATSITYLFFSVGVCTGFGFGLIYLPAIVSVSMYFEKKRAFATGIAVCGSGLGTFIMAPVTEGLITSLGWEYAILIVAGLVLTCIAFGCLMRPLESSQASASKKDEQPEEEKPLTLSNGSTSAVEHGKPQNGHIIHSPPELQVNGTAVPYIQPFAQQMGMANGGKVGGGVNGKYNEMARMAMSHPAFLNQAEQRPQVVFGSHSQFENIKTRQMSAATSGVMARKDIFYSGSLYNIPEFKDNPHTYRRSMRKIATETGQLSRGEEKAKICCCNVSEKNARVFRQMVDISLFRDPIFLMYAVSNFFTSIGFNVPYVYTVDRARGWGIDEKEAAFLLSIIGIANTLGRLFLGWLSDQRFINRLYLYNSCLVLCGISMGLSSFMTTYNWQIVYCAIFGVTSGAYVGLTSVVLVDLLGLDKLTNAFGLLLMFQGIASVIGPPFTGALYDTLGDYDAGFYFAGTMIFISGAMLFAIPVLQRKLERKKPTFDITSGKGEDEFVPDV
jgi:MFS family permease